MLTWFIGQVEGKVEVGSRYGGSKERRMPVKKDSVFCGIQRAERVGGREAVNSGGKRKNSHRPKKKRQNGKNHG